MASIKGSGKKDGAFAREEISSILKIPLIQILRDRLVWALHSFDFLLNPGFIILYVNIMHRPNNLDMLGAKVKEYSTKDQKYCFEVSALNDKKGGKKYVFAAEKEHFRTKWIEMIKKVSRDEGSSLAIGAQSDRDSSTDNPMVANSSKDSSEAMATMSVGSSFKSTAKSVKVAEKYGYLSKKSPRILIGWQKRFFHLKSSGEIIYYENVSSNCNIILSCSKKFIIYLLI